MALTQISMEVDLALISRRIAGVFGPFCAARYELKHHCIKPVRIKNCARSKPERFSHHIQLLQRFSMPVAEIAKSDGGISQSQLRMGGDECRKYGSGAMPIKNCPI